MNSASNSFPLPANSHGRSHSQAGLTLVELLVALVISTVIAVAAVSALVASRQGFSTVDAAAQLRENARFATELIRRLGVQAGFDDVSWAASSRVGGDPTNPDPNVTGFNNSTSSASDPSNVAVARTGATSPGYGSDVLVIRYQIASTFPSSGVSDLSMIDCSGNASTVVPVNRDDRAWSVIHVAPSAVDGELSLMCSSANPTTGVISVQPIIRGVENFQVLYGVVGVIPNTAPTGLPTSSVADRYLRADQMTVPGNLMGTNDNWRRVRSLRIGMILRGPVGSFPEGQTQPTLYPLGQAADSSGGTAGSALSSATDPGTIFTPAVDRRLRQVVTFTIHLRNEQGL
ncbi:PilW family protein [Polaromonas sp.]|uniref:PilW family protein n=1 Tax=Polaromonas sp. TaxID=1869339 RepID=UPI00326426CD